MDNDDISGSGYGGAANRLVKLFADAADLWIEPARIKRVADAKAEESRILTDAEIERELALSNARYRMEVLELRRQKNLEVIAKMVANLTSSQIAIDDQDLLVEFVESCKDTADPTLQEIWARLLAGEMESKGSCSKRTLRMVKSLSREEATLIKDSCRRICIVEEDDGTRIAFLPIVVSRLEHEIGEDRPNSTTLFDDDAPGRRARDRRLLASGFLSDDDYKFTFSGEGYLDPARYQLSRYSAKKIEMGTKSLIAALHQPGLLFPSRRFHAPEPSIRTPSAILEIDAWKLSPEGEELFRALREGPDYGLLEALKKALTDGGLSITET